MVGLGTRLRCNWLEEEGNYYTVVQYDRANINTCHRVVLEIRFSLIDGKNDKNLILTSSGYTLTTIYELTSARYSQVIYTCHWLVL